MTVESLYTILDIQADTELKMLSATVAIDEHHEIFKGHFPDNPILPGVCHIEIIGELLKRAFKQDYVLAKAKNMKFLNVVVPDSQTKLIYRLDISDTDQSKMVKASAEFPDGIVNFKLSGTFIEV